VAALRKHLKQGPQAGLQPALGLGRQAAALGLETLDLARIHERAIVTLEAASGKDGIEKRAEIFFTEAIIPVVETHRAARQSKTRLNRLNKTLSQRTEELAASKRQLQRGVVRRKVMEDAFKKSGQHHKKCLEESLQLQKRLRQLTHRVMASQEDERKNISRELQDEIAQTLLGINVRLLSLKQHARNNTRGLKNEIASTQALVLKSAKSVRRVAREIGVQSAGVKRSVRQDVLRDAASNPPLLHASAGRIMGKKSSPAHRPKKPAKVVPSETAVSSASRSFPVIAMAASVGGLKALSVILGGLPGDFPAAIAIVMHVSPDHKSLLAEILNSRTHLTVKQAHTGDILCHSSVFVAPPNHHLFVAKGGRLELSSSASEKVHHARPSAEPLFASVADIYKKNAIAVVLTGGDGDGSFGVQIIKEKGGKVIAQDRPTSQDFSMPETSIKTGDVDFILPLDKIAPKLIALVGAGGGQKMAGRPLQGEARKPWQNL
jgi:two-component system chemotaxis response regulator CheB